MNYCEECTFGSLKGHILTTGGLQTQGGLKDSFTVYPYFNYIPGAVPQLKLIIHMDTFEEIRYVFFHPGK